MVGRLPHLDDAADVGDCLALGDQLLGHFSLRIIRPAVCQVRFMVVSPAQFGHLSTLIHPVLMTGLYVIFTGIVTFG